MRKKLSPYHSYFYDRAKDRIDLKLEDEDQPFEARSEIIQDAHAAHKDIVKYLEDNFKDELSHYKENIFPRAWMLKDTIIQKAMQQHPKFIPIMNALHNRNRHSNGTELIKIQQEVNRMSHGRANLVLEEFRIKKGITRLREAIKTYGKTGESNLKIKELQLGKRLRKGGQISREEINLNRKIDELAANKNELKGDIYLSYFITNDALYKDLHKATGIPINTIKEYIPSALANIGNIKKIYDGGKRGNLYIDGWFAEGHDGKLQKHPFLIDTKPIRKGLKELRIRKKKIKKQYSQYKKRR